MVIFGHGGGTEVGLCQSWRTVRWCWLQFDDERFLFSCLLADATFLAVYAVNVFIPHRYEIPLATLYHGRKERIHRGEKEYRAL